MRTMHPVLKRGGLFWDETLLPRALYAERFDRIRALIAASGDDAWLVYGDVERYGDVAYFSNFLPRTRSTLALVPREGEPAILISVGQRDVPAAKLLTWVDDVRPFSDLAARTIALIREKGLAKARFGLVGVEEYMSLGEWSEIEKTLDEAQWHNRTTAMSSLREVKDRWEIGALRRSAAALADAFAIVPQEIGAGMTTRQLTAAVDRELRRGAAEDVRILVGGSFPGGDSLRPGGDWVLRDGDSVTLYAAGEVQRYWAAAARTFVLGPASTALRELAGRAHAALAAMRKAAVPGAKAAAIAAAADAHLADRDLHASATAHGLGHGIGLDPEEAPRIATGSDHRIRAGASLALQVIGRSAGQSIAFGDMILVGAEGSESLTGSAALIECPALLRGS